ncbi:MAG: Hsp20/alpha crystallin family protein [Planctomycetota bacterium]|nr:MAG: Hsp20/alpha crystallin family protein [Planctomycetota bacterium]
MGLIPWKGKREPVRVDENPFEQIRAEMDRIFESFFEGPSRISWPELPAVWGGGAFQPALDVAETDREVVVRAELPGLESDDFEIDIAGNRVVITGEKRESHELHDAEHCYSECRYGRFERAVSLPEGVDTDRAEAEFANGVLTLRIPKLKSVQARKIKVKVKKS